ncbi:hypothetical protein BH23ACT2_BH23ACT2_20260 [soil metagenome]
MVIWDLDRGTVVPLVPPRGHWPTTVSGLVWDPTGEHLLVGSRTGTVAHRRPPV